MKQLQNLTIKNDRSSSLLSQKIILSWYVFSDLKFCLMIFLLILIITLIREKLSRKQTINKTTQTTSFVLLLSVSLHTMSVKVYTFAFVLIVLMIHTSSLEYLDNFTYTLCKASCNSLMGSITRPSSYPSPKDQAMNLTLDLVNPDVTFNQIASRMGGFSYSTRSNHYHQQRSFKSIFSYANKFMKQCNMTVQDRRALIKDTRLFEWIRNQYLRPKTFEKPYIKYDNYYDQAVKDEVLLLDCHQEELERSQIILYYPQLPINQLEDTKPFLPFPDHHYDQLPSRMNQFDLLDQQIYEYEEYKKNMPTGSGKSLTTSVPGAIKSARDITNYLTFAYLPKASADEINAFASIVFAARFGNELIAAWDSCNARKYSKTC